MYKWLPLPDNHPKKGEIPASSLTRGGGLKRFCSELISSLRKTTTSELANPMFWGPADQMHPDTPGGGVEAIYTEVRTPVDVAGVEPARYDLSAEAHPMICFSET